MFDFDVSFRFQTKPSCCGEVGELMASMVFGVQ